MTKRQWRLIFLGCLLLLSAVLLLAVHHILAPFIVAFVLAYILNPFVSWLEKRRVRRRYAVAIVFVTILGGVAAVLFLVLPRLYMEITKLATVLPQTISNLAAILASFRENLHAAGLPSKVTLALDQHLAEIEVALVNAFDKILDNLPKRLSSVSLLMISPVLAIYFLLDWDKISNFFLRLVPRSGRIQWQRILQDISYVVRSYIRGDVIVAIIVGILTAIGVKLVGMDYALLIGAICAITDLIPYFGPIIGAVPAILLALTKSPLMAVKVAVVLIVVQQLESNVISPKIVGDQVGLHPLWIVFALLAGGELWGVIGMLLAVPAAGIIQVIIRHIYRYLVAPEIQES